MKKPIIIAIVGASGSGKTTLSLHLQATLGIPALCSYTTRPMRPGEINGREHWFVDFNYPIPKRPLAYTFFGGHHYWTDPKQITSAVTSYVIDERGLLELMEDWSDSFEIIALLIKRSHNDVDADRKKRDKGRIVIPEESYNLVLFNDDTLDRFLNEATALIQSFLIPKY